MPHTRQPRTSAHGYGGEDSFKMGLAKTAPGQVRRAFRCAFLAGG